MKTKKLIAAVFSVLLSLGALTSCGDSNKDRKSVSTSKTSGNYENFSNNAYDDKYSSFISEVLIPRFGLAELNAECDDNIHYELLGLVSAVTCDIDGDGTNELLSVTREQSSEGEGISEFYINLYKYDRATGSVEIVDRISTETYPIKNTQTFDEFDISVSGNVIFQKLKTKRYGSVLPESETTEYTFITLNENKLEKYNLVSDPVCIKDKSTGEHIYVSSEAWEKYYNSSQSGTYQDIREAEKFIRQTLEEMGFNYERCRISEDGENGSELLIDAESDISVCSYSGPAPSFNTTDKTNIRNKISLSENKTEEPEQDNIQTTAITSKSETASSEKTTQAEFSTETPTRKSNIDGKSGEWEKIYAELLIDTAKNAPDSAMFDLYDVDGDDVPELFVSMDFSKDAEESVYTIDGRNTVKLDLSHSNYGSWNILNGNIFCFNNTNKGAEHTVYAKEGNKTVKVTTFESNYSGTVTQQEAYFKVNGKDTSYEEYQKELDKYLNGAESVGRTYQLDKETITAILS